MSVLVCIPTRDGNPHIKTVTAINRAVAVFQDASVIVVENRHNVCASRNEGVVKLLNTDADHLLFVDDDTTIPPDTIPLLLECDSPVATGCVPTIIDGRAVLAISERKKDLQWRDRWFGGIQDIELCGAACLLIRRELFENMAFPSPTTSPSAAASPPRATGRSKHTATSAATTLRSSTAPASSPPPPTAPQYPCPLANKELPCKS
jgi:hypothetical protein